MTAPATAVATEDQVFGVSDMIAKVADSVERVIEGKHEPVSLAISVLLAEGHLLIEDVPGVGKTMLAKALARSIDCSVRRIQFTSDLLPSDITGVNIFDARQGDFQFRPGAIFANIVIGDEINRASPKTQSSLLESMEEQQVTVDGRTYQLPPPFMVIATQNPIEMAGTYPLPEAQRDRFMAQISMGYPSPASELDMIDIHAGQSALDSVTPVASSDEITAMIRTIRTIYVAPALKAYAISLVGATRIHPNLRLGASPRATLHLVRMARARAASDGRHYVVPDDLQQLAIPVLAHRVIRTAEAAVAGVSAADIISAIVNQVPDPGQANGAG